MKKALRILLAGVAIYCWGFVFWGLSPLPYQAWLQADDDAAQPALRELFPKAGTYYIPGRAHSEAEMASLFERGPIAMVHMADVDGRPMMDPSIMAIGFGLCIFTAALIALVVARFSGPYAERMKGVVVLAFAASFAVHLGDVVWWSVSLDWKVWSMIYDFAGWAIAGAILARDSS
jgi:hypothetical protein